MRQPKPTKSTSSEETLGLQGNRYQPGDTVTMTSDVLVEHRHRVGVVRELRGSEVRVEIDGVLVDPWFHVMHLRRVPRSRSGEAHPNAPGHTCDPDGGPIFDLRCEGCLAMLRAKEKQAVDETLRQRLNEAKHSDKALSEAHNAGIRVGRAEALREMQCTDNPIAEDDRTRLELPMFSNNDAMITCIFCRSEKPCEYALRVKRDGEQSLVGIHERCVAPLRRRNAPRAETPSAVDWRAESIALRKMILKPSECPNPESCDNYSCDVNRTIREGLARFDALVTGPVEGDKR